MATFTKIKGQLDGIKSTYTTTLDDSESEIVKAPPVPCTISVIPGANTGLVQYTTSPESDIDDASATWQEWSKGSVTSNTSSILLGNVSGLKFSATGGEVTFEIVT